MNEQRSRDSDPRDTPGDSPPRPPATAAARSREVSEHAMRWAAANLRCADPHDLEARGVNVYFAPNVKRDVKVVNLADGRIDSFRENEHIPPEGYFAEYASLEAYCRRWGAPLLEVEGVLMLHSAAGEAGDPLQHPPRHRW